MTQDEQVADLQTQLLREAQAAEEAWSGLDDTALVRARAKSPDPAQVYSVRIPVERIDRLRRLADERGVKPTALMREWVLQRLAAEELTVRAPEERMVELLGEAQRLAAAVRRRTAVATSAEPKTVDDPPVRSVRLGATRRLASPLDVPGAGRLPSDEARRTSPSGSAEERA